MIDGSNALHSLQRTVTAPLRLVQQVVSPGDHGDHEDMIRRVIQPLERRLDALADDLATRVAREAAKEQDAAVRKALKPLVSELANLEVEVRALAHQVEELRTQSATAAATRKG